MSRWIFRERQNIKPYIYFRFKKNVFSLINVSYFSTIDVDYPGRM